MKRSELGLEEAAFGAGCFWGVEETFRTTAGVAQTQVGYMGGKKDNPAYEEVCTDKTGHAEVVHLKFDPKKVSYEQLLDIFWASHNPTTLNRQGPDVGSQYRSVIFFYNRKQESAARKSKEELQMAGKFGGKSIVTEITPAEKFNRAEEYHQKYLMKRGLQNCHI